MLSGISIWQLLIILVIVVLLFGTSRLRSLGGDLGSALKSFRSAVREGEKEDEQDADESSAAIESTATTESESTGGRAKRKAAQGSKKSS